MDKEGVRVKLQNIQNETTMKVACIQTTESSQSGIQREIYSLKVNRKHKVPSLRRYKGNSNKNPKEWMSLQKIKYRSKINEENGLNGSD